MSASNAEQDTPGNWLSSPLALGDNSLTLTVSQPGQPSLTYEIEIVRGAEQGAYVKASNTGSLDAFGYDVALAGDGDTLAIGAFNEASAATGVDGDASSNGAARSGAVYVFVRSGSSWVQQAYLKASNTGEDDRFGTWIALSEDGDTLAVGAPGESSSATGVAGDQSNDDADESGAAYVFTRTGSTWSQHSYLKASNTGAGDAFGSSVTLSSTGNTLAVGAPGESSTATGLAGDQSDNGASRSGATYVFTRAGASWNQRAYLKASNTGADDAFGKSVVLSDDGTTLVVGAPDESSAASGVGGNQSDDAAHHSGAVYVFTGFDSNWTQQAYVKASTADADDAFGAALTLSSDGNTLAVGAYGESSSSVGIDGPEADDSAAVSGAVYVFVRTSGSSWAQEAYLKASNTDANDYFGSDVALSNDGHTLLVGATGESSSETAIHGDDDGDQKNDSAGFSGALYVFTRSAATWAQLAYVKASNTDTGDSFGRAVALSGDGNRIAVGADREDSVATGLGGDQADDSAMDSGAVYVFR